MRVIIAGNETLKWPARKAAKVSMSHCLTQSHCLAVSMSPRVSGLRSLVSPSLATTHCLAARWTRRWRSGNRRADMRPETRDLAGGHETLRPSAGGAALVAAEWATGGSPVAVGPAPTATPTMANNHASCKGRDPQTHPPPSRGKTRDNCGRAGTDTHLP